MSVLTLYVDEVMRTLSNDGQYPFVENDKTVDIVRFALNTGFTDVVLDEHSALRVMYQRPGETEVRTQTLTYHDTDGLRNYYDWQLLSSDLAKNGSLMVALCILRTDGDVEEWHTTPYQIRVLGTIHTDDSDEGDESITPTVAQRVAVLETMIQRVASGAPIVVASTSAMTDTNQIYVLSTDGNWYYHNGTAWVAGGEYGGVLAGSITTDKLADGAVTTAKIADGAITAAKLASGVIPPVDPTLTQSGSAADAKIVGDNISDLKSEISEITGVNKITEWTDGGYILTGRSIGETVDVSTVVSSSAYQYVIIPCDANDELIISGLAGTAPRLWCFLDADNKVISSSSANATADKLKLTIPLNTAKAVLNRNISNIPCYIGKTPKSTSDAVTNFLDYYTNAKNAYMCNVLNKDTLIEGGHYNGNNVWVPNADLYATDYIPCKSGEVYSFNYSQDVLLYDINKIFLGKIFTYATKTRHAFVVPTYERPVCFFRSYGVISQKETDGVYNAEEYIGNSKSIPYGNIYLVNPKTKNKIIHTFGDSRTWYDLNNYVEATTTPGELCIGYQSWMRRYLTTVVFNHGVSGYTTPQINTVVHNTNISNADVITLAGGINDFLHSTEIGTIQSIGGTFDTATVYGALQSMIEYILETKPDVKLMLINPFTGWLQNDTMEFPETYAKIKRDVAELYKLPLLDLTKMCGFNSLNRDAFYCDDMTKVSYRLHLNNKGNEIIGQMISSFVANGF